MFNQRRTILCIIAIFFIINTCSVGIAQSGQKSDSALSGSQYNDLIELIHQLDKNMTKNISELDKNMTKNMGELENRMRDHVDDRISALRTDINNVRQDVAFINGQLSIIKWALTIIGGPLLVVIIGVIVNNYFQNRRNKNSVTAQSSGKENTDQTDTDILPKEPNLLDALEQDDNSDSV